MDVLTYFPDYLTGLWITTTASLLSFAGALVLGVVTAVFRRSGIWPLRTIGAVYVEVIRNTPSLVQIFLIFFGLPSLGVHLPAFESGVIALAINGGAYLAEIIRAGLNKVPSGQTEAARTLGLGHADIFFHVVFPQAARYVYPPVINEFIQIILATSLLSTVALNELTGTALVVNSLTFQTLVAFGVALVLYLILTNIVSIAAAWAGRRMFHPPLQLSRERPTGKAITKRLTIVAGGR